MKSDAIAFGIAGVLFGLIAGWIIGIAAGTARPAPAAAPQQAAQRAGAAPRPAPPVLDETQVTALKSVAEREPTNAAAARRSSAICTSTPSATTTRSSGTARRSKLAPNDVNVSTDLGVCYYYTNQPDKALEQFDRVAQDRSEARQDAAERRHREGVRQAGSRRRAKQAWQQVIKLAPDSPEGQAAKRALDSLQSAHPGDRRPQKPGALMLPRSRALHRPRDPRRPRVLAARRRHHRRRARPAAARQRRCRSAASRWCAIRSAARSSLPERARDARRRPQPRVTSAPTACRDKYRARTA